MFDSNANKMLAKDYASLILLPSNSNVYSVLHIQGSHIEFQGDGRAYCTRCAYEVKETDLNHYGFHAIINALPRMMSSNNTSPGISPICNIAAEDISLNDLDENAKKLYYLLNTAILKNTQLFIKLKRKGDEYKENNLFESPKLEALLKIMDLLPVKLRPYASLSFSIDANVHRLAENITDSLIIVHQDDISNWNTENAIVVNWESSDILTSEPISISDADSVRSIAALPILDKYIEKGAKRRAQTFLYIGNMKRHLDMAMDEKQPDENDINLLGIAYENSSPKCYRHKDMVQTLYKLLLAGDPKDRKFKHLLQKLHSDYSTYFSKSKDGYDRQYYIQIAEMAETVDDCENILSNTSDYPEIKKIILRKLVTKIEPVIGLLEQESSRYPLVSALFKNNARNYVLGSTFDVIVKYYNSPYLEINEDIKKKLTDWPSLKNALNGYLSIQNEKQYSGIQTLFNQMTNDILSKHEVSMAGLIDIINELKPFEHWLTIDLKELKITNPGQDIDNRIKKIKDSKYYETLRRYLEDIYEQSKIVTIRQLFENFRKGHTYDPHALSKVTQDNIVKMVKGDDADNFFVDIVTLLQIANSNHQAATSHLKNDIKGAVKHLMANKLQESISDSTFPVQPFSEISRLKNNDIQATLRDYIKSTLNGLDKKEQIIQATELFILYQKNSDNSNEALADIKNILAKKIHQIAKNNQDAHLSELDHALNGGNGIIKSNYLVYPIIAVLAALIGFFPGFFIGKKMVMPTDSIHGPVLVNEVSRQEPIIIDADIPEGKIGRPALIRIAKRIIERTQNLNMNQTPSYLYLDTDNQIIKLPLTNNNLVDMQMLDTLFGKSLTKLSPQRNDSVYTRINGRDSVIILDSTHRLFQQLKGIDTKIDSIIVSKDKTNTEKFVFDNQQFEETYHVASNFNQLLYYFYVVKHLEEWRRSREINKELSY